MSIQHSTRIAAAINLSPESFYKGSVSAAEETLEARVRNAQADGADMIDLGAMSTAPYKETRISEEEEIARMVRGVSVARRCTTLPISADTQRAAVARAAISAGASIINDVSALLHDPAMGEVCAAAGVRVILMANDAPDLEEAGDRPSDIVVRLLREAITRATAAGIARENVILDPGIGFFRQRSIPWYEWDLELLRNLGDLQALGCPVMIGASRKSLFGKVLGRGKPEDRLAGSLAVAAWCTSAGIQWLRVHDVRETADVIRTLDALNPRK